METPPNYSQYPRGQYSGGPTSFGQGSPPRPPGIYFDYINVAFNMIWKNPGVFVLGTFLILLLGQVINLPLSLLNNFILYGHIDGRYDPNSINVGVLFAKVPLLVAITLIPVAILQIVYVGLSLCAIEQADTGYTSLNGLFSGFKNGLSVAGTSLLYFLAIYVGFICCIIPGFYVIGALGLAPVIAAKEGLGPIQALQKSYNVMKPYAWSFVGLLFVCGLLNIVGVLACCIGTLWTIPIQYVVIGLTYRDICYQANPQQPIPSVPTF